MPMKRELYPDNWEQIAEMLKAAAGWKCQTCRAEHDSWVAFHKTEPTRWLPVNNPDEDYHLNGPAFHRPVLIQLGVAHLDQNPGNNAPDNLRVLCRGCHLRHDAPFHGPKAAKTKRDQKREAAKEAGQIDMFGGG